MQYDLKWPARALFCSLAAIPPCSHAINGAQPGGRGVGNAAMGGASIALPLDAVSPANNPAGLSAVPDSVALDAQVFHGRSSANYVLPDNNLSNRQTAFAPEGGGAWHASPELTLGLALVSSGTGADYNEPALPVPGADPAKSFLRVAELMPTVAWQPVDGLSVGLSLDFAREQFDAEGVIVPANVPGGLLPLPSHGTQSAAGRGARVGVLWHATPEMAVGVTVKARTHMGALSGYRDDLLAYTDGHLDLPSEAGVGVSWRPTERLTVASDLLQIRWGELGVMQDPHGFHWRNQNVWRLGGSWALDPAWSLRAGYSHNNGQIPSDYAVQNVLVPAIHRQAWTMGVAWKLTPACEINLGYELDPTTTLHGTGASTGTTLESHVQMFMLGWQTRL
jgi:long-chain fatty acid transport protein